MIEILNGRIEVDDVHNLGHPSFPVQFFPTTSLGRGKILASNLATKIVQFKTPVTGGFR